MPHSLPNATALSNATASVPAPLPAGQSREIERLRDKLADTVMRHVVAEGMEESTIAGLHLGRANAPTQCVSTIYEPCLCVIVQGSKTVWLGDREIVYGPLSYLVSSVHLPVRGRVEVASPSEPFLSIRVDVDPQEVTELVLELGDRVNSEDKCPEAACGLCTRSETPEPGYMTRAYVITDTTQ